MEIVRKKVERARRGPQSARNRAGPANDGPVAPGTSGARNPHLDVSINLIFTSSRALRLHRKQRKCQERQGVRGQASRGAGEVDQAPPPAHNAAPLPPSLILPGSCSPCTPERLACSVPGLGEQRLAQGDDAALDAGAGALQTGQGQRNGQSVSRGPRPASTTKTPRAAGDGLNTTPQAQAQAAR